MKPNFSNDIGSKPEANTGFQGEDDITTSADKKMEPYFTLINEKDHFRIICTTMDNQNMPMRDDILVVEKKGCHIYSRSKFILIDFSFKLLSFVLERKHDDTDGGRAYPTYGIIGIMNIESHIFIIIITERNVVA